MFEIFSFSIDISCFVSDTEGYCDYEGELIKANETLYKNCFKVECRDDYGIYSES